MPLPMDKKDVVVIGGGPAGLGAALSLEALGLQVTVIDPAPLHALENPSFDGREIALTHHTVALMQSMGVWDRIRPEDISVIQEARVENGDENDPLTFDTKGKDEEALGYLVPNCAIRKSLFEEAHSREGITILPEQSCEDLACFVDYVTVQIKGEKFTAKLAVLADGRFSKTRDHLGIGYHLHDFHRHMMVTRLEHELPHHGIALQWFDKGQTIALLPLNGNMSSIVLSLPPDEMNKVRSLDQDAFTADISQRLQNRLGKVKSVSSRHVYPLKTVFSNRFETRHTALVGDTAIGMHPITAHGFNFAMTAQEILAQEVEAGIERGEEIGAAKQLRRYERRLRQKTFAMFTITNTIATLYTREEKGLWLLRQAGMRAANLLKPLKDKVVDQLIDKKRRLSSSSIDTK
ncbi:2-polyprenyl-6-methoxyphenol hydroxylase and related FAD-dependent oxidoreductases (UbiH) (PDB:1BF3) [Commensalibacter communis]|uniref:5-demethoxyubiquinol-8 5-hydroxylase UbiM n=1 Tax=Commensalibacter communis TaxID=2972786 RepID=UPI0022FF909A|nr:5-demethoxyubiquinol-8 5-hydroxylase UbiM [Commensalibacter communis]CAI3926641.1 2-polyprenyl-6-methoxyphenol hydroxylase and related FAD-dependent oxidoreductases (UbiH) (PDB:1BF3) [Commensalibacter communis]